MKSSSSNSSRLEQEDERDPSSEEQVDSPSDMDSEEAGDKGAS